MKTINGINILYEDNHMIVAVKPAGMLSQADKTEDADILSVLRAYLKERYQKPGNVYLGLLHRLDRPVSGVMVFAKTSKCASRISAQIRDRKMTKKYRAILYNHIHPSCGTLRHYIEKDSKNNRAVFAQKAQGKEAILNYYCLATSRCMIAHQEYKVSLVDVDLITGRTHQIRFQLSDLGFPIVGDRKYNDKERFRGDICLESYYLALKHPTKHDEMIFEMPMQNTHPWTVFGQERTS